MDFGEFPKLTNPTSYVSANVIIYRSQDMHILVCRRTIPPWEGFTCVDFGGFIDPSDLNPAAAAIREAREETGLLIKITHFIRVSGPERYHYTFDQAKPGALAPRFIARRTNIPASTRPAINFMFAGYPIGGELKDCDENTDLRWIDPVELVGHQIGFCGAKGLADFLNHAWDHDGGLYRFAEPEFTT